MDTLATVKKWSGAGNETAQLISSFFQCSNTMPKKMDALTFEKAALSNRRLGTIACFYSTRAKTYIYKGGAHIMANAMNDRLKDLLHKRNLSQRELAKLSGVTESSISHYLKGDRVPTSSTLTKLAETLGTTPDYLLFGKPFTEIDQLNSSIETVKRCAAYLSHAQKLELISALVDKDKND